MKRQICSIFLWNIKRVFEFAAFFYNYKGGEIDLFDKYPTIL